MCAPGDVGRDHAPGRRSARCEASMIAPPPRVRTRWLRPVLAITVLGVAGCGSLASGRVTARGATRLARWTTSCASRRSSTSAARAATGRSWSPRPTGWRSWRRRAFCDHSRAAPPDTKARAAESRISRSPSAAGSPAPGAHSAATRSMRYGSEMGRASPRSTGPAGRGPLSRSRRAGSRTGSFSTTPGASVTVCS